jgi:hypothetical protein
MSRDYYTYKLDLPNTPLAYAVKEIVEFWPEDFKSNEGRELLTSFVMTSWLVIGTKILQKIEEIELKSSLSLVNLSAIDTIKEAIKIAENLQIHSAYVESWLKFSLAELTLCEELFKYDELWPSLEMPKQQGFTHLDLWIKTQKEWKFQEFTDVLQSTGQRNICDRWRNLVNRVNPRSQNYPENPPPKIFPKNPFYLNSEEFYRYKLVSGALQVVNDKNNSVQNLLCSAWRCYADEFNNHLKTLRHGVKGEGKKNLKKNTLKVKGNKIVALGNDTSGSVPLDPIIFFKSGRGRKCK